ncbi:signal peptidase complex subunit 2-like [Impatiens glandulifera]|uniref:signal peptidase complex subunit 2-like n=1 Tax=Impatiens glandulifera TaxID=253017 RepID=UPI001FB12B36|nr:signal peptidase complex subunit 2-like [Impatiens glandulifera]
MPETTKTEMATSTNSSAKKSTKKINLLDHNSIKNILDESVNEIVTGRGHIENVKMSNIRLFLGIIIIGIALVAQFYPKKFPENRDFLIGCIILYILFNAILQLIIHTKEKNAILFTYPPTGSFSNTGLIVSSKLPRFSDLYTLTIASADPKSILAKPTVELTKSVTQWFTKDGVLVEGLFWKDVDALLNKYAKESKKSK